jgi:hypothetical protein
VKEESAEEENRDRFKVRSDIVSKNRRKGVLRRGRGREAAKREG